LEEPVSLTKFGEKLELRAEIEIHVPRIKVWNALTDLERYFQWNPYIVRATGKFEVGQRIELLVSPPDHGEMRVRRNISVLNEPSELRWSGPYGFGLLLKSDQYFLLSETADGASTRLTIGENLFGPGVTGSNATVMNIARGLALMNQALKRRLESARFQRESD
jgi:hypothetical protein